VTSKYAVTREQLFMLSVDYGVQAMFCSIVSLLLIPGGVFRDVFVLYRPYILTLHCAGYLKRLPRLCVDIWCVPSLLYAPLPAMTINNNVNEIVLLLRSY